MTKYAVSIKQYGFRAILLEWPRQVEESILDDVLRYTHYLKNDCLPAKDWEFVTAYNSLTLIHNKADIDFDLFKINLEKWYAQSGEMPQIQKHVWRLPVCYDPLFGIDLVAVSEKLGKSVSEIIALHTNNIFTVYGIGFLPGFMYLGGLPEALEVPRKPVPRLKVNKGAVGLAAKQTGIYPQESPGGWNIIGNCPISIFDVSRENPCFVSIGDKVQFYPIEKAKYDLLKIEAEVGIYKLEKQIWDA